MWNFFNLSRESGLNIYDSVSLAPQSPGYYLLFSENGNFIYIGKTNDLKTRLAEHFSSGENNSLKKTCQILL